MLIDQIHPDDQKTVGDKFVALAESKQIEICVRYRHKDGHYIWLDIVAISIDPERSIGFTRDITERLNAESERSKLEHHLQQAQKLEVSE